MSDPAHKCYSKHASIESDKTKKAKKRKIKYCLRQENGKKNTVQLSYDVYMQLLKLEGN